MPFGMSDYPQAAVMKSKLYVGGRLPTNLDSDLRAVMVYDCQHDKWNTLPLYHYGYFAMAAVNNQLVLAGGYNLQTYNCTAVLGAWDEQLQKWSTPFPPMPTARCSPSAVSHSCWLVVIGGRLEDVGTKLSEVEILDTRSGQWYAGAKLPLPLSSPSVAIIGYSCYVIGGFASNHAPSRKVYRGCLDELISQAVSHSASRGSKMPTPSPWHSLPDSPLEFSAALALDGSLLTVGGEKRGRIKKAIYLYQLGCGTWVKVGELHTGRSGFACRLLPDGKMIVAGGGTALSHTVEVAEMQ